MEFFQTFRIKEVAFETSNYSNSRFPTNKQTKKTKKNTKNKKVFAVNFSYRG